MNADFKEINPLPAERVKQVMKENKTEKGKPLKAVDLHHMTGISEKHLSNILTLNKPLTEGTAKRILAAFPKREYRLPWLLGYDGYKTEGDKFRAEFTEFQKEFAAAEENQNILHQSVAAIMALYGVTWDGSTTIRMFDDEPVTTYKGHPLTKLDLKMIAEKVYRIIGMELEFASNARAVHEDCLAFHMAHNK